MRNWTIIFGRGLASRIVLTLIASALFFGTQIMSALPVQAAQTIPYKINFQGRLTDQSGNILANGSYNVKFRLFDALSAGTNKWEEDRVFGGSDNRITVTNGLFNVQFGDVTALTTALFSGVYPLYLEVELPTPATATCASNGCASFTEGAMTPRQPLASSPYAFNSDTLDGLDATAFAQLTPAGQQSGSINVSGNIQTAAALQGSTATLSSAGSLTVGTASSASGSIAFKSVGSTNTVTLTVGATAADYSLNLPLNAPSVSQCLQSDSVTAAQLVFGACSGAAGANAALSNLAIVAINTALLPITNNSIDAGSAALGFRNGYFATSVSTPLVDTISAGALTIGNTYASSIALGKTGSNIATTINGTALVKPTAGNDSATAFQVQNATNTQVLTVDTIKAQTILTSANTDAVLGITIDTAGGTNPFPTGWGAPAGWTLAANSATHTAGTTALASTWLPTIGTTYQVTYTYSACTAANTLSVTMGGVTLEPTTSCIGTNTQVITATSTAALTFTPNSTYIGVVSSVVVQALTTQVGSVLTVKNSSSVATLEVRSSGSTSNIFIGLNAGKNNTSTGVQNTALGTNALQSNTTGSQNTASGYGALQANTTGSSNTASGYGALQANTTGTYNTAYGNYALSANTTGSYNTASGYNALQANTTGTNNTASGVYALYANTTGSSNTASGYGALQANTTGTNNTASGYVALYSNTTGFYNTASGNYALSANTTGTANTASGYMALYANTTGSSNTASGYGALQDNTTGTYNTASGYNALSNLTTLTGTISATVTNAGNAKFTSTSTTGLVAGLAVTISGTTSYNGSKTVASVDDATHFTITTAYSTADAAGSWTTADSSSNTAEGYQAGQGSAVYAATGNSLFGYQSGFALQSGANYNSLFGYSAGSGITTGTQNLLLGYNAGTNLSSGSNNVLIGQGVTAPVATGSNQLQIGVGISGDLSTGTLAVKTTTNSTTAFQVQNAFSAPIFLVDTTTNNLVTNPGFEVDTSGWAGVNATLTRNVTMGQNYEGVSSNTVNVTTNAGGAQATDFTAAVPAATYVFSFYAMRGTNTGVLGVTIVGGGAPACALASGVTVTTGFQQYSCSFTASSAVTAITVTSTLTGTFYLDAVQLVTSANNRNNYDIGNIQLRGVVNAPATFQSTSNSMTAFQIQNSTGLNLLTVDSLNANVIVGSAAADATQILLQMDSFNAFVETDTCTTTVNQGALYYNSTSNAMRACINGGWEDVVSTAALGLMLFGVVPDSGTASEQGDLGSLVSAGASGPCKVSWASATSVAVRACTAYSGGRKIIVAAATLTTALTNTNDYNHVCLNGTNNQPQIIQAGTEDASLPSFSQSVPVLCLADIYNGGNGTSVVRIYDTRTFTTTTKEFATINAVSGIGWVVTQSATVGLVQKPAATIGLIGVRGVIVASSGFGSTTTRNIVIATAGPQFIKGAGTSTVNQFAQTSSTTAAYTSSTAAAAAAGYANLGLNQRTIDTTCTAATNCQFSQLLNIALR